MDTEEERQFFTEDIEIINNNQQVDRKALTISYQQRNSNKKVLGNRYNFCGNAYNYKVHQ